MFKKLLLVGACLFSVSSMAAVDCEGIVATAKLGEYGSQEGYYFIGVADQNHAETYYRLGLYTDPLTKARMEMVHNLMLNNKHIRLKFYGENSCADAARKNTPPNSVQSIQRQF